MAFNGVVTADGVVEPPYGLFSAAEVENHGGRDEHWIGGFYVESSACGVTAKALPLCIAEDDTPIDIFNTSTNDRFFHVPGFGILETWECDNSIGINAIDRRAGLVKKLTETTEYAVERELWLGEVAQVDADVQAPANRWLANATDVTPTPGTAVKARVALALVEQNFTHANPGIQATVHVTPLIAAILGDAVFTPKDGKLYTSNGNLVSISRGGDGTVGPHTGGSATKHWIYATGPVHVDLGVEELITTSYSEIVNPITNAVTYTAERPAAVYFDGCSWFGALADATL